MQVDSLPSKPPGKLTEHITCIIKHANIKNISNVFCAQSPLPMEFSRQEYQSEVPFPTPGDLPDPGIEPQSLVSPGLAGRFFTTSATWEATGYFIQVKMYYKCINEVFYKHDIGLVRKKKSYFLIDF